MHRFTNAGDFDMFLTRKSYIEFELEPDVCIDLFESWAVIEPAGQLQNNGPNGRIPLNLRINQTNGIQRTDLIFTMLRFVRFDRRLLFSKSALIDDLWINRQESHTLGAAVRLNSRSNSRSSPNKRFHLLKELTQLSPSFLALRGLKQAHLAHIACVCYNTSLIFGIGLIVAQSKL